MAEMNSTRLQGEPEVIRSATVGNCRSRHGSRLRTVGTCLAILTLVGLGAGCSSGDDSASGGDDSATTQESSTTTTAPEPELPTVLVTNDDGVGAEGIDALVTALVDRGDVEVVVVAPAANQSGSGGKTTPGELVAADATTVSGHEAKAVDGFPADSVRWALQDEGIEADLVISGINEGQNIGPLVDISGTVGAARQAAQLGVPAVATSQGGGDPVDFPSGVAATMQWLDENYDALVGGTLGTDSIININTPSCPAGPPRGEARVPLAVASDVDLTAVDCEGPGEPIDDVNAFVNGWIAVSPLEPTGSITG